LIGNWYGKFGVPTYQFFICSLIFILISPNVHGKTHQNNLFESEISINYPSHISHKNREVTYLYDKVITYFKDSKYKKVIELSGELLKLEPIQMDTRRIRAFAAIKTRDFKKSLLDSGFILANEPDREDAAHLRFFALLGLSDLLISENKFSAGAEKLSEALKFYPSESLRIKLTKIYWQAGEYKKAEDAWKIITKKASPKIQKDVYVFFNNYGQKLYESKKYKEAVEKYNTAISLFPENNISLVNRGNTFIAMKKYTEAKEDFREVLTTAPNLPLALYGMGLSMYYEERFPESYRFFSRLLKVSPTFEGIKKDIDSVFHKLSKPFRLGLGEFMSGNYPKAHELMETALKNKPSNPVIIYFTSKSLFEMNKNALPVISSKVPDEILYPESIFLLGKIYFIKGDFFKAEKYFSLIAHPEALDKGDSKELKKMIKKLSILTAKEFQKGYEFFLKKNYIEALEVFSRIDDGPEVAFYVGNCYLNLGILPKAIRFFQKAAKLDTKRIDYLFTVARTLYLNKNLKMTKIILKDILRTSPYHAPSRNLMESIKIYSKVELFLQNTVNENFCSFTEKNVTVEVYGGTKKTCREIALLSINFSDFLERTFPSLRSDGIKYNVKILKKERFKKLRKLVKQDMENFIFYNNNGKGGFVGGYLEEADKPSFSPFFIRNLKHTLFHNYIKNKILQPPKWIEEGLAAYVENSEDGLVPNKNRMVSLKMMFMSKKYYELGLQELFLAKDFRSNPQVYYQEAYGFCKFLSDSSQMVKIISSLRKYDTEENNTQNSMPTNVLSVPLEKLENEFEVYIDKQLIDPELKRGLIMYKDGELDKAISSFKSSIKSNPMLTENMFYMGLVSFKNRELDVSYKYFEKYMELENDRTSPLVFLAAILKAENNVKFKKVFEKAEKFEPLNPLVLAIKKELEKDQISEKLRKQSAKTSFLSEKTHSNEDINYSTEEEITDRDARVANNTGVYYLNSGLYEKAEIKFEEALSIEKKLPPAMYNLGITYFFMDKNREAKRIFLDILKTPNVKPKLYLYLSKTYLKLDDKKKSDKYLRTYTSF